MILQKNTTLESYTPETDFSYVTVEGWYIFSAPWSPGPWTKGVDYEPHRGQGWREVVNQEMLLIALQNAHGNREFHCVPNLSETPKELSDHQGIWGALDTFLPLITNSCPGGILGVLGPRVLHFWPVNSWTSSIFHWLSSLLFIMPCASFQTIPLVLAQEVLWLLASPGLCPLSRKPVPLQGGRLTTQSYPQPPAHRPPLLWSQDSSLSPLWPFPSTIPLTGEGPDILCWQWAFCPSNREDSLTV